jgi:hypothetical protein
MMTASVLKSRSRRSPESPMSHLDTDMVVPVAPDGLARHMG